jgi:hypothetical protein
MPTAAVVLWWYCGGTARLQKNCPLGTAHRAGNKQKVLRSFSLASFHAATIVAEIPKWTARSANLNFEVDGADSEVDGRNA